MKNSRQKVQIFVRTHPLHYDRQAKYSSAMELG